MTIQCHIHLVKEGEIMNNLAKAIKTFSYIKQVGEIYEHKNCAHCKVAKSWFENLANSHHEIPPRWIGKRWKWGPNLWPVYWCELAESRHAGCMILSKMVRFALDIKNIENTPVQVIEKYDKRYTSHIKKQWNKFDTNWIDDSYVFHEMVGIKTTDKLSFTPKTLDGFHLWDPSEQSWREVNNKKIKNQGNIIAYRFNPTDNWTIVQ